MKKYRIYCKTDSKYETVICSGDELPTKCPVDNAHSVDFSGFEILDYDVKVNDGSGKEVTLDDRRKLRYNEIDAKTMAIIAQGFTYDGKQFSLSVPAQLNWDGLKTNENDFTWPVEITTVDNDAYSLVQANVTAFWSAGKTALQSALDSGRALKKSVHDAVDDAGVDAVVDNR